MRFEIQSLPTTTRTKSLKKQGSNLTRLVALIFPTEFDVYLPNFLMALNDRKRPFTTVQEKQLFCSCKMDPTNTPRVFHVETTRRFNVEYTWSVSRVHLAATEQLFFLYSCEWPFPIIQCHQKIRQVHIKFCGKN